MKTKTDYELMIALNRAADKAPDYAVALNLSAGMLLERTADAAAFQYTLAVVGNVLTGSKEWTALKKLLRRGPDAGNLIPFPLPIDFGTAPATIKPGVATRYSKFAAHCRLQPACTENVAIDLGIATADEPEVNLDLVQPVLKLIKRPEGIFLDWTWDTLSEEVDTIEILVDRGDGQGDRILVIDSTPGSLDTATQPAPLTKWTYKGIWRVGETQVGLWSNPVSIVVGG